MPTAAFLELAILSIKVTILFNIYASIQGLEEVMQPGDIGLRIKREAGIHK
jgi:hypothetical protein